MIFVGTLILYSFLYLGIHNYFPGMRIFFILATMLLVGVALRKPKLIDSKINTAILLLFTVMMLTIPFSSYRMYSLNYLSYGFNMLIIGFITYCVLNSQKKLSIFVIVWLCYHIIIIANSIAMYGISNLDSRYGAGGLASSSFLGDANDLALSLNIALPIAIYLMLQEKSKSLKCFYTITIVLLIVQIILTNSRGGFITLFLTLSFIWYQNKKKFKGLIIVFAIITSIVYMAPEEFTKRMDTIISGQAFQEDETGGRRINHWRTGLKMMADHPFSGVGLGRFPAAYGSQYNPKEDNRWRAAHNSYVSIGAEAGIISLILFIYLLYTIFRENISIRNRLEKLNMDNDYLYSLSKALTAALVAFCIGNFALTAWHYIHLFFIISITLVIKKIIENKIDTEIGDQEKTVLSTNTV